MIKPCFCFPCGPSCTKTPKLKTDGRAQPLVDGLTAPQCPEPYRREVAWVYSQGSPPIFAGDVYYYDVDHDLRAAVSEIDTNLIDVYLLTGEYDWSATPEMSEQLHQAISGSSYQKMSGIGHFPMCENPRLFLEYVRPVLAEIAAKDYPPPEAEAPRPRL